MNRIMYTIIALLVFNNIYAQGLEEWSEKYYSEAQPDTVRKNGDGLTVIYHPLIMTDTIIHKHGPDSMKKYITIERRITELNLTRVFKKNMVTDTFSISKPHESIKYYELKNNSDSIRLDALFTENDTFVFIDKNVPTNFPIQNTIRFSNDPKLKTWPKVYRRDTFLTRRDVVNMVGELDPNNWYFGANFVPAAAYRSTSINSAEYREAESIYTRDTTETAGYGQTFSIQLGYTFSTVHTLYAEFIHMRQGFMSTRVLDWRTSQDTAAQPTRYRYYGNGVGLGYNYSGYRNVVNLEIDMGIYHLFSGINYDGGVQIPDSIYSDVPARKAYIRSQGVRANMFGVKAGLGLNIRPEYRFEIRLVPTIYYNIIPTNLGGPVNTRLYNIGIAVGIAYRPFNKVWTLH